jgi:arylsulfatase A-like enzyme
LLKGEVLGERALFLTARFSGKSMERPQRAVRRGRHKLVRRKGHDELYDLEADPGEEVDLSSELPALARSLSADLDTWIAEAHEDWVESESEELSEETLRALEAIGYAGDE